MVSRWATKKRSESLDAYVRRISSSPTLAELAEQAEETEKQVEEAGAVAAEATLVPMDVGSRPLSPKGLAEELLVASKDV